jgi:type II secretory pathway component GspD/PulD (secretin)
MHGVTIVPETASNSLLVGGPKSRVEVVLDMVKDMDHPAAMVEVELQISEDNSQKAEKTDETGPAKEETAEDAAKGQLSVSPNSSEGKVHFRAVVSTLDNQEATITVSRQEPQIVGMSRGPVGMSTNSVNMTNVGTQITLTPRIDGNKAVVLALKISESRLDREENGAVIGQSKDNHPIMTPSTEQFTAQTTVRLEDAKPVILGGLKTNGQTRTISVTARIIRPGETKPARHEEKKL